MRSRRKHAFTVPKQQTRLSRLAFRGLAAVKGRDGTIWNFMRTLFAILALIFMNAAATFARVGETQHEITARYGAGGLSDIQRMPGAETYKYFKDNFQIEVVIYEGKSIWEIIQRQDADKMITDAQIKDILNVYKEGGHTWFFDQRLKRWERSNKPKYVAYRWPGHEDYLCVKDLAACDALEKGSKGSKGL